MAKGFRLKLASALGVRTAGESGGPPTVSGSAPSAGIARTPLSSIERPPSVEDLIDFVLVSRTEKFSFFRPSMLGGCNRANVFHYKNAPWHPQRQNPRLLRILDNGSAVHELMQGYLADHPEWWFAKEARIHVQVGGALIRGSCDGVLIRRTDLYRFGIEVKSINHDAFIKITKPKPEHVFQARIYCKLQGLEWIVVVYWDKDKQLLKEYAVRHDPNVWKDVTKRVSELHGYVARGEIPAYDEDTCDTTFCSFVNFCRLKGAPV